MNVRILVSAAVLVLAWIVPAQAATKIEEVISPGGIKAWLVEDHSNPIIALDVSFSGGASLDPEGKAGLSDFVSDLLDEGAGDLDSQTFQGKLQDLSIQMSFNTARDTFDVGLKTLTDNRDTAFSMLGLALTKPRFDPDAIERIREQVLSNLSDAIDSPNSVANRTLAALLFPKHPYGRPSDGDPDSIKAITRDDLVNWVGHHLGRDTMIVSVVGDITPGQLKPLLDSTFGGLPAKADPIAVPDTTPAIGIVKVVHKPVPQSVAVFAEQGVKRNDPDWYTALVMNYILGGGGFSSRLMTEVREKRGLAYQTDSYLLPREHAALIGGQVGTRNDRMAESLAVIRAEWTRMAEKGVTDAELAGAKKFLNGSFPLELGSTGAIAELLDTLQRNKLGIDYLDRRTGLIDSVTAADVKRVAHKLLVENQLVVVVVGNPKGME
ncbi:MAG TPA: pitrilysin family protein [Magnetospirillaceae bacterium]|jgi:zinc protease